MNNINVPSYKGLLGNIRQARALQDLYDYISRWKSEIDEYMQTYFIYKDVYIGCGDTYSEAMIEGNHHESVMIGDVFPVTANNNHLWVILTTDDTPTILMNGILVDMAEEGTVDIEGVTYKVLMSTDEFNSTFNVILL